MRQKVLHLLLAACVSLQTAPSFASLDLQASIPKILPISICPQRDFTSLHHDVAHFLTKIERSDGTVLDYSAQALNAETKDLPRLLRQYRFFAEATLVERQIALLYATGCVTRN